MVTRKSFKRGNKFVSELAEEVVHENHCILVEGVGSSLKTVGTVKRLQSKIIDQIIRIGKFNKREYDRYLSSFSGISGGFKPIHMDFDSAKYVCLCYGARRNVIGGRPVVLNIRSMARQTGIPIAKLRARRESEDSTWGSCYYDLTPLGKMYAPMFQEIIDTDLRDKPMLLFSNLLKDGVMHGATNTRRKDGTRLAARGLHYAAVRKFDDEV